MLITLYDWENTPIECDIGELDNIAHIEYLKVSGDEVLEVLYNNGELAIYDKNADRRTTDFLDNYLPLYNKSANINLLNDPDFLNRAGRLKTA